MLAPKMSILSLSKNFDILQLCMCTAAGAAATTQQGVFWAAATQTRWQTESRPVVCCTGSNPRPDSPTHHTGLPHLQLQRSSARQAQQFHRHQASWNCPHSVITLFQGSTCNNNNRPAFLETLQATNFMSQLPSHLHWMLVSLTSQTSYS